MKARAFLEAEEPGQRRVKRTCELLEVSKAAYYQSLKAVPSARACSRRRAGQGDRPGPRKSPTAPTARPGCRPSWHNAGITCGRRRVARLMRLAGLGAAASAAGAPPPSPVRTRRRRWTSSNATSALRRRWTPATSATSRTSGRGPGSPTWPPSSTWPAAGWSAGRSPTTCAPSWSKTPCTWPSPGAGHPRRHFSFATAEQYTSKNFAALARANGVRLSSGPPGAPTTKRSFHIALLVDGGVGCRLSKRHSWPLT